MDVLRTMGFALSTLYAVVGLTVAGHGAVQRDEVLSALSAVLGVARVHRQRALVLTFIIMYEDGRNVNTVRTGHAVFAVVAGDILQSHDLMGYLVVEAYAGRTDPSSGRRAFR